MKNRSTLKVFIYLSFVFTLSYSRWPLASSSQVAYKNRNEKQKHIKSVHLFVCLLFFLKSFVFSFLTVGGASGSLIVSRVHINNVLANISSTVQVAKDTSRCRIGCGSTKAAIEFPICPQTGIDQFQQGCQSSANIYSNEKSSLSKHLRR